MAFPVSASRLPEHRMRAIFFTALGSMILAIVEAGLHWYGRCLTGYLRKTGAGQNDYLKLGELPQVCHIICPLFPNSFKAQYSIHEFLSPNVVFM